MSAKLFALSMLLLVFSTPAPAQKLDVTVNPGQIAKALTSTILKGAVKLSPKVREWLEKGIALAEERADDREKETKELLEWLASAAKYGIDLSSSNIEKNAINGAATIAQVNSFLQQVITSAAKTANERIEQIEAGMSGSESPLASLAKKILEKTKGVIGSGSSKVESVLDQTANKGKELLDKVAKEAAANKGKLEEALQQSKDKVSNSISSWFEGIKAQLEKIKGKLTPEPSQPDQQ